MMKTKQALAEPKLLDCAKCERMRDDYRAIREDFKRAQDHHAVRIGQEQDVIVMQREKLAAGRDFARLMLSSEQEAVRHADAQILALLTTRQ